MRDELTLNVTNRNIQDLCVVLQILRPIKTETGVVLLFRLNDEEVVDVQVH